MATSKRFFHDKLVLLLVSLNALCVFLTSILVLLRLDSSHSGGYIVQYRQNLGLGAFKKGSVVELVSFIVFSLVVFVLHMMLSLRVYDVRRQLAVVVLGLGSLLLLLALIVSNSLLILR